MGESTEDGSKGSVPGDGPVAMRLDEFGGFAFPNGEVKVSDGRGGPILSNSGEEPLEDDVKVDRHSCKDVLPLRSQEGWKGTCGVEGPERMFKVCGIILDHGAGALEILQERDRSDEFMDLPGVERLVDLASLGRRRPAA